MQIYISSRILLTLSYTEQFDFPLNKKELYSRLLISCFVDLKNFNSALSFLKNKNLIKYFDGYFFVTGLSNKKMEKLSKTRKKRAQFAVKKWQELNEFVGFAKYIPFITGVAVTGSLAVNNTIKDDDIDFMVVTTPGRLWITRLIVILYSSLKGKRRSFAKEEANSWCFNLWIEETDLQLPVNSRSVYESYEVIQAVWVLSKNNVSSKFEILNNWVKKFVYFSKFNIIKSSDSVSIYNNVNNTINTENRDIIVDDSLGGLKNKVKIEVETEGADENKKEDWSNNVFILSEILYLLNLVAFYFQYLYMKPHMTREKVSKSHAFFHPRDTKSAVFSNWKEVLLRLV